MRTIASAYLWMVGFVYFVLLLVFALILSFLLPARVYNPWLKRASRFLFRLLRVKVVVEGIDRVEPGKTYLYMANHASFFDLPLLGGYLPGFVRGVESHRQHGWPLYGWVMRRLGNIPIDRDHIQRSISSIRKTIDILNNGQSMAILPEGYRSMDGKLREFKKLPFFLAKQVGTEIVPVGLVGVFQLKSKLSWHISPTPLIVRFGTPIPVSEIRRLSEIELRDRVRNEIGKLVERA